MSDSDIKLTETVNEEAPKGQFDHIPTGLEDVASEAVKEALQSLPECLRDLGISCVLHFEISPGQYIELQGSAIEQGSNQMHTMLHLDIVINDIQNPEGNVFFNDLVNKFLDKNKLTREKLKLQDVIFIPHYSYFPREVSEEFIKEVGLPFLEKYIDSYKGVIFEIIKQALTHEAIHIFVGDITQFNSFIESIGEDFSKLKELVEEGKKYFIYELYEGEFRPHNSNSYSKRAQEGIDRYTLETVNKRTVIKTAQKIENIDLRRKYLQICCQRGLEEDLARAFKTFVTGKSNNYERRDVETYAGLPFFYLYKEVEGFKRILKYFETNGIDDLEEYIRAEFKAMNIKVEELLEESNQK